MEAFIPSIPPGLGDHYLIAWTMRLASALVMFILGRRLAKYLVNLLNTIMQHANLNDVLAQFVGNHTYTALLVAVVIASANQLGVQTTSLLAIAGAACLAIALTLKESLANFSSGIMLTIFRPFKVGDLIEVADTSGVVEAVNIFSTLLKTGDNREITVPNSHVYSGIIINVTARATRRIDMVFGIGYDDDIRIAKQLITAAIQQDARILIEPAANISVTELADSSVNLNVRPWVQTEDYWAVRSELLENIKSAFNANGISIPYTQRDMYLHNASDTT